jgi:hypothetical protein
MKKRFAVVFLSAMLLLVCSAPSGGEIAPQPSEPSEPGIPTRMAVSAIPQEYYVDPVNGDDENSGTLP